MSVLDTIVEKNIIPDWILRSAIWFICYLRIVEQKNKNGGAEYHEKQRFIESLFSAPIAIVPEKANEQHYEVASDFYDLCLGSRKKYSSCYWDEQTRTLDEAEEKTFLLYAERAKLSDGQDILELGCGWGSCTLWIAEHFPHSCVVGVSNSNSQREYIDGQAKKKGLTNIRILTCDMNQFSIDDRFDRIVSIEMFEHMRNWPALFSKVSQWLKDDGMFFLHVFTHKTFAYAYEDSGSSDWMARYFFSGGMMPSDDMPLHFQEELILKNHWRLSGTHYEKTARAWLDMLDKNRTEALPVLSRTYGHGEELKWLSRWRIFFMACEVLFGYKKGSEWGVSHYLFSKRGSA